MNADLRTLPRTSGRGVTSPVRETGSSALDLRPTWPAPDPSTMMLPPSGALSCTPISVDQGPWPAPDPSTRVEHPPPVRGSGAATAALVEPIHPVDMPSIAAAQRAAADASVYPIGRPLPPPTLDDAAAVVLASPGAPRVGVSRRFAVRFAAAAGVACAAAAAAVALL